MAYTGKPQDSDVASAGPVSTQPHPPGASSGGYGGDLPMTEAPGAPGAPGDQAADDEREPNLSDFMMQVIERNASDLHMTAGLPPMVRVNGVLKPILGYRKLFPQDM